MLRIRLGSISVLTIFLLILTGCGGGGGNGGGGSTIGPPLVTHFAQLTPDVSNEGQPGLGGTILYQPVAVQLLDANNSPVVGATISLSSSSGADFFPPSPVTVKQGYARFMVRLPHKSLQDITVTATATGGASHTMKFSIGPDVISVFGNARFGTFLGADDRIYGNDILGSDGSLAFRTGVAQAGFTVPEALYRPMVLGIDGNLYFENEGLLLKFDGNFHPLSALDIRYLNAPAGLTKAPSFPYDRLTWVGADGTMYFGCSPTVTVVGPDGMTIKQFGLLNSVSCVVTPSGELLGVTAPAVSGLSSAEVAYVDSQGHTTRTTLQLSSSDGYHAAQGSHGETYVQALSTLDSFSSSFAHQFSFGTTGVWPDILGSNSAGDLYFGSTEHNGTGAPLPLVVSDSSGNVKWCIGVCDWWNTGTAYVNGVPDSQSVNLTLTAASGSETAYVCDGQMKTVNVYQSGTLQAPINLPLRTAPNSGTVQMKSMTADPAGLQLLVLDGGTAPYALLKLDVSGKEIGRTAYSQFQAPAALAVASDGTRYVFDGKAGGIHVIDALGQYVRLISINGVSQFPIAAMASSPDGNFLFSADGNLVKMAPSGAQLWSKPSSCASLAVDQKSRVFCEAYSVLVYDDQGTLIGPAISAGGHVGGSGDHIHVIGAGGRIYRVTAD